METTTPFCSPPVKNKEPIDGWGPRGAPDCYYKSRTLNSTIRYARFVKKLRMSEEEVRKGQENNLKELKDQQILDFFIRCDRRSLINNVARRVDLCMQSYKEDLEKKKQKLKQVLEKEEEANIYKLVVQAQQAKELQWKEKMERLQYLLDKRSREHLAKYENIPLSKCVHVKPCIVKLRKKESADFQLYQIQEKQSMKMQELEMEKMWNEVAMKESDALAARMEIDAIDRYLRDKECMRHNDLLVAQREKQRQIDRQQLREQQLAMKAKFEADMQKEREEEEARRLKRTQIGRERKEQIEERQAVLAKQQENEKLIDDTWASFGNQSLKADKAKLDLVRRRKMELNECNKHLVGMKKQLAASYDADALVEELARKQQDAIDKKRCDSMISSNNLNKECRKTMLEQIKDKIEKEKSQDGVEEREYFDQLKKQSDLLVANRALEELASRKQYQDDLRKQIEYKQLLKDRAIEEEIKQRKKAEIADREYETEISKMLSRKFFSDDVHPFVKQMMKLEKIETCPCVKPNWCKQ